VHALGGISSGKLAHGSHQGPKCEDASGRCHCIEKLKDETYWQQGEKELECVDEFKDKCMLTCGMCTAADPLPPGSCCSEITGADGCKRRTTCSWAGDKCVEGTADPDSKDGIDGIAADAGGAVDGGLGDLPTN